MLRNSVPPRHVSGHHGEVTSEPIDQRQPAGYWRVELTVRATKDQVDRLGADIAGLLCPDPDHAPPCPIPWEIGSYPLDEDDPRVTSLRQQVLIESPGPDGANPSPGPHR